MNNFDQLLRDHDLKLFEKIKSQSTDNDKRTFLACQFAVRNLIPEYNYLEIGSHRGGSIQPYLLDEQCRTVYSIDKRSLYQPDERGLNYKYPNNSTARMLELLQQVAPIEKIKTIDGDTRYNIETPQVKEKVHLCLIDAEHTDEAVFSDFKFCLNVLDEKGGAILFHDAPIIYNGIADCVKYLQDNSIEFHAYSLPDAVFAIEIGDFPLHKSPLIAKHLLDNHLSYLHSLQYNNHYRQFANKKPFLIYRQIITKLKGSNVSD